MGVMVIHTADVREVGAGSKARRGDSRSREGPADETGWRGDDETPSSTFLFAVEMTISLENEIIFPRDGFQASRIVRVLGCWRSLHGLYGPCRIELHNPLSIRLHQAVTCV